MPAKHANDLVNTYAKVAEGYESIHSNNANEDVLKFFEQTVKVGGKILDLGAGNGRDSRWLVDHGFQVTMFDLSPEMLAIAKSRVPNAVAIEGDMTEMNFEESSFDGVWASASILHLTKKEARKVIKDIFNILKHQGVFYCLLKKGDGEFEVEDDKYGQPMNRFFAFYQKNEVEKMLENAGFEILEISESRSKSGQEWIDALARKN